MFWAFSVELGEYYEARALEAIKLSLGCVLAQSLVRRYRLGVITPQTGNRPEIFRGFGPRTSPYPVGVGGGT